jgi:hypothetical protein
MAKNQVCWALWVVGTAIIVASWTQVVTPTVGWVGFAIALAGTGLSMLAQWSPLRRL